MHTKVLIVGLAVVAVGLTGNAAAQSGRHVYSPLHISVHSDGKDRTIKAEATDEKGTSYLLREVNDKVVEFKVNGTLVSREDYSKYVDVFDQIEDWADAPPVPPVPPIAPIPPVSPAVLIAPVAPIAPVPPVAPSVGYFVDHIIRDLSREKLIEHADPLSFSLDNDGFTVNGVKQPAEVFKRYKEKYIGGAKDHFIYDHHGGSTHSEVSTDKKAPEFI